MDELMCNTLQHLPFKGVAATYRCGSETSSTATPATPFFILKEKLK
jgi:hypothetical protein